MYEFHYVYVIINNQEFIIKLLVEVEYGGIMY